MARRTGLSPQTISLIESGSRPISADAWERLTAVLHIDNAGNPTEPPPPPRLCSLCSGRIPLDRDVRNRFCGSAHEHQFNKQLRALRMRDKRALVQFELDLLRRGQPELTPHQALQEARRPHARALAQALDAIEARRVRIDVEG